MESITDDNDKSFIQVQKHKNKTKNHISEQKKKKKMLPLPRPTTIIHQAVPSTDFFKFIFLMYKPNEGINQNTCIPLIRIHAFHASTQMY